MSEGEWKKVKRKENRKRKAIALLNLAELNDEDKRKKNKVENTDGVDVKDDRTIDHVRLIDKPLLEGEEYEDLKKRLKERKKALTCNPLFRLKSIGYDADIKRSKRVPLFMSDVQNLISFCMVGDRAPCWPNRWAVMSKWNRLSNMVCLVVDRVGVDDFLDSKEISPWFHDNIGNLLEVVSPASYSVCTAEELALMPISVTAKKKLIQEFGSLESALEKDEAFKVFRSVFPVKFSSAPKTRNEREGLKIKLLLSASQMIIENYPIPLRGELKERYKDFKFSRTEYQEVSPSSPLYSVDCEMCLTSAGSELTRVCVVDSSLKVVYHSMVKPPRPIINYLTKYSGITEDMLKDVTTTLEDVQRALSDLLPPDSILIGHSLNSDLMALKLAHPYVIDTSVCFNIAGQRPKKAKLAALSHLFLNMPIQQAGKLGHSPIEDAQAAMKLVLLKLEKGLAYGDAVLGGEVPQMSEDGTYKVPEDVSNVKEASLMTSISKTLKDHEKTVALVADESSAGRYESLAQFRSCLSTQRTETGASAAVEAASTLALGHNLTICHLDLKDTDEEEKMKKVKKYSKKLHCFTSINGMFLLVLAGTETQNGVVGVVIRKPEER